jgi:hypothetical protein
LKLDPALLALAYAVSIAEERHPAAYDFEENDHFRVVKLKNAKMRKRENFAFRELYEVHNAKAFFAFLRRELHVSEF